MPPAVTLWVHTLQVAIEVYWRMRQVEAADIRQLGGEVKKQPERHSDDRILIGNLWNSKTTLKTYWRAGDHNSKKIFSNMTMKTLNYLQSCFFVSSFTTETLSFPLTGELLKRILVRMDIRGRWQFALLWHAVNKRPQVENVRFVTSAALSFTLPLVF